MPPDALADEAEKLLARGFRAVKLRLGYPTLAEDLAAVHAVRKRIRDDVALMVDYNQALGVDEALARGRALDREGIAWLEEPIRHDDYAGARCSARALTCRCRSARIFRCSPGCRPRSTPSACDLVMPDLERIGGVTGWLRRRGARGRAQASRCRRISIPEVSAHLLAATPTAHFLEYVDWADKVVQRAAARSSTARPSFRIGRATASSGTRPRSINSGFSGSTRALRCR